MVAAVYGAAMGGGRLAALFGSDDNVVARALRKPAAELDVFDACAVACLHANEHGPLARGGDAPVAAAGFSGAFELLMVVTTNHFLHSKKIPDEDRPRKLLRLSLEQLRATGTPSVIEAAGLWNTAKHCIMGRVAVAKDALEEYSIFDQIVATLRLAGSPAEWSTISSGHSALAMAAMEVGSNVIKMHDGERRRPDKQALIASGLFDMCCEAVQSYELRAAAGRDDTQVMVLYQCLGRIRDGLDQPGSRAKIEAISSALHYCLLHDQVGLKEFGYTTAAVAANLCAGCFGRDDGDSKFVFTQGQVDNM
jgi:hypothetical protein